MKAYDVLLQVCDGFLGCDIPAGHGAEPIADGSIDEPQRCVVVEQRVEFLWSSLYGGVRDGFPQGLDVHIDRSSELSREGDLIVADGVHERVFASSSVNGLLEHSPQ